MSVTNHHSFNIRTIIFLVLSTTALSAHFRVCEPYFDHKGRYHFGFHCPRLSDNKTYMFCCHHNNTAFKYCCNETEFQTVMQVNLTTSPDGYAHNNYSALIGVWIYGFFVMVLLALDFLYYSAMNYEVCRVYLEKCGLGGRWLKQARSQWHGDAQTAQPAAPSQPQETHQHGCSQARHSLTGDTQSPTQTTHNTTTACSSLSSLSVTLTGVFPKSIVSQLCSQPSAVQRVCVSRNHRSNEHSQTASQSCVFGTTAPELWLEEEFLVCMTCGLNKSLS